MKVAKVVSITRSAPWLPIKKSPTSEARGLVEVVTLQMTARGAIDPELKLTVNGVKYELRGFGMPRIDIGEEIILHCTGNAIGGIPDVAAIQIVHDGKVVFRALLPQERHCHFAFED